MPKAIPPDSTIKTIWPHLTHQNPYVSGVLHKMRKCNAEQGRASVKIGVGGTGQKPNYKIFSLSPEDNHEIVFGSFHDNHEPLEAGTAETTSWSAQSMTFDELLNFYADSIGYKGKRV
jgi:hypothetical protein